MGEENCFFVHPATDPNGFLTIFPKAKPYGEVPKKNCDKNPIQWEVWKPNK